MTVRSGATAKDETTNASSRGEGPANAEPLRAPGRGNANEENRGGARVHFEALVAVGEMTGNGGFEAESVDVSADGMRLRTAHLPNVGDKLVCRFDGAESEVVAEAEVVWVNEEAKGGEFGLRFTTLDPEAQEALKAMCTAPAKPGEEAPAVAKGARVRLHIEGLGSPMKARVRESAPREVEVGSNLEFLRVGRSLEIEDVDQSCRREAFVERVKVDVDPNTNVPQLVVSLRFGPEVQASAAEGERAPATIKAARSADSTKPAASEASNEDASSDDEAREGVGAKAARLGGATIGKVGPLFSGLGSRAKGAMTGMMSAIAQRRAAHAEQKKASGPKRMTAPPAQGALKSEGRRLVRDDGDEEEVAPPPKSRKRAALIGSVVGLAAVLAVFGATRVMAKSSAPTTTDTHSAALPMPTSEPAVPANASPGGSPVANVPLFGATPLSTTEPVLAPAPSADPSGAPSAAPTADPAVAEDGANDKPLLKEWGQGSPSHPITLKIKMDGPIEGLRGAAGAAGFTLTIPGRHTLSSPNDLARKDKRIAQVTGVNNAKGTEITIQFKDEVPTYVARVKGDKLEIAIGKDAHGKVAKKKGDGEKHKHHKKH